MAFQKGDVVLVPIPFTNQRQSKVRPVIVVSGATYHATEPDIILAAITTNLSAATAPVDYILTEWQAANLRFPSAFKPILFTIEPNLVVHRIGRLHPNDQAAIDTRLRRIFELT